MRGSSCDRLPEIKIPISKFLSVSVSPVSHPDMNLFVKVVIGQARTVLPRAQHVSGPAIATSTGDGSEVALQNRRYSCRCDYR